MAVLAPSTTAPTVLPWPPQALALPLAGARRLTRGTSSSLLSSASSPCSGSNGGDSCSGGSRVKRTDSRGSDSGKGGPAPAAARAACTRTPHAGSTNKAVSMPRGPNVGDPSSVPAGQQLQTCRSSATGAGHAKELFCNRTLPKGTAMQPHQETETHTLAMPTVTPTRKQNVWCPGVLI